MLQRLPASWLGHVLDFLSMYDVFQLFVQVSKDWQEHMWLLRTPRKLQPDDVDIIRVFAYETEHAQFIHYLRYLRASSSRDDDPSSDFVWNLLCVSSAEKRRAMLDLDKCPWIPDTLVEFLLHDETNGAQNLHHLKTRDFLTFCQDISRCYRVERCRSDEVAHALYAVAFCVPKKDLPFADVSTQTFFVRLALQRGDLRVAKRFGYKESKWRWKGRQTDEEVVNAIAQRHHPNLLRTLLRQGISKPAFAAVQSLVAIRGDRDMIAVVMKHPFADREDMYRELCYAGHGDTDVTRWFLRKYRVRPEAFLPDEYCFFMENASAYAWFVQTVLAKDPKDRERVLQETWKTLVASPVTSNVEDIVLEHLSELGGKWNPNFKLRTLQTIVGKLQQDERKDFYRDVWKAAYDVKDRQYVILWIVSETPSQIASLIISYPRIISEDVLGECAERLLKQVPFNTYALTCIAKRAIEYGYATLFQMLLMFTMGRDRALVESWGRQFATESQLAHFCKPMFYVLAEKMIGLKTFTKWYADHDSRERTVSRLRYLVSTVTRWQEWACCKRLLDELDKDSPHHHVSTEVASNIENVAAELQDVSQQTFSPQDALLSATTIWDVLRHDL